MGDFKQAYQEFQDNIRKLRKELRWVQRGLLVSLGILILTILLLIIKE